MPPPGRPLADGRSPRPSAPAGRRARRSPGPGPRPRAPRPGRPRAPRRRPARRERTDRCGPGAAPTAAGRSGAGPQGRTGRPGRGRRGGRTGTGWPPRPGRSGPESRRWHRPGRPSPRRPRSAGGAPRTPPAGTPAARPGTAHPGGRELGKHPRRATLLPMAEFIPAAIYCRISQVRDGSTLGVDRQEPPTRALCARLGWRIERVFVDNDLSAYGNRRRPDYEEMLAWAQEGRIRAIAAWDADRLTRKPRENEDLIDLADQHGIRLATVTGEYDLATSSGRLHFRIRGAIARHESEHRAERIRLKQEELAHAGRLGGGGTRPFGYLEDRVTPHTFPFCLLGSGEIVEGGEAALVREAAERVLLGEALHAVLTDWTKRGVPTVTGKPWRSEVLAGLLLSPRIAGLR